MIRFHVFSNPKAKDFIEESGYRCTMLESASRRMVNTVAIGITRESELKKVGGFLVMMFMTANHIQS